MMYRYQGDRHTDPALKNVNCWAVRNQAGKCVRGRNGNMLVQLSDGTRHVIVGRRLRKQLAVGGRAVWVGGVSGG